MNLDLWLTKSAVAARLGVSEKTVERLAQRGQLHRKTRRIPGRRNTPVYSPDDVNKIQEENLRAPTGPGPLALAVRNLAAIEQRVDVASRVSSKPATLPPALNSFLTVDEAAEYLNCSPTFIRRAIKEGHLPAIKDGCTRIRWRDLEKL
jgi:excisionase family DNA binding protein